jgi:hypothetical protein
MPPQQYVPPSPGGAREQMKLKILSTLLPAYPVAALLSPEEHFPIAERLLQASKVITAGPLLFQPPGPAALVSRLAALLARHNKYSRLRIVKL